MTGTKPEIPLADTVFHIFARQRFDECSYRDDAGKILETVKEPIGDSDGFIRRLRVAYTGVCEGLDPNKECRLDPPSNIAELMADGKEDLREFFNGAYCTGSNNRPRWY